MKNKTNYITAADLRCTYYGEDGRIKLIPTARSWTTWWLRHRLPYHVESAGLYFRQVGYKLRRIEWQNNSVR
jgi:hypothetical protein